MYYAYDYTRSLMFAVEQYTSGIGTQIELKHKTCNQTFYTTRELIGESEQEAYEKAIAYCQRQSNEYRLREKEAADLKLKWLTYAHEVIVRKQKHEGVIL